MNLNKLVTLEGSLFLKCRLVKLKIMRFVNKSGYAQLHISKGSMFAEFSLRTNDVNNKLGNIAEVRVIITKTRVIRKTPKVTRLENCDSIFLNTKILKYSQV